MTDDFREIEKFPIWKKKYEKMGVSARELYMRQNGLCYLKPEVQEDGAVVVYCTDGKDKAETANMLNPTIECVKCMMRFTTEVISREIRSKEPDRDSGSGHPDS